MALIKCPECSNEVSDTAISCPKCGLAFKEKIAAPIGSLDDQIKRVLVAEGKISAIKLYREHQNVGLAEAKEYVERLETTLPPGSKPKAAGCASVIMVTLIIGSSLLVMQILR